MSATELAVIVVASAAGSLVKGVTGMGFPLLAVPLIALVLGVEEAVVIVAAPNLAANAYLCWETRRSRHETRDLPRIVGFGIGGAAIGTLALVRLPEEPLLIALAATIGVFVLQYVRHPDLHLSERTSKRWSPVVATVAGTMQGAVGVSGPVVATWVHGYRLAPRTYVFTVTLVFGVTGAVQLGVLGIGGELTAPRLVAAAVAAVPAAVMTPIGVRLRSRLDGTGFERAVLGVLALSAVSLLVEVIT